MNGLQLIQAERTRQVEVEGWTHEHDDEHGGRALWHAAECYEAGQAEGMYVTRAEDGRPLTAQALEWPWERDYFKPAAGPRNLIRSGALFLAAAECYRRTKDDRPNLHRMRLNGRTEAEAEAEYVQWVLWLADLCDGNARRLARQLDEWLTFTASLFDPAMTLDDRAARYLDERRHTLSTEHLTGSARVVAQARYVKGEASELVAAAEWLQVAVELPEIGDALREVRHEIADTVISATITARTLDVTVEDCIAEKTAADRGRG